MNPIQVPCVVARKARTTIQPGRRVQLVSRPAKSKAGDESNTAEGLDDIQEADPVRRARLILENRMTDF